MSVIYTSTSAGGNISGRKVTRLSNGWLVALVSEGLANHYVMKSTNNGTTWSLLTQLYYPFSGNKYISSTASIASTGTTVFVVGTTDNASQTTNGALYCFKFDATTVGTTYTVNNYINGPARSIDMVYDASTNTIHVVSAHYQGVNGNYVCLYNWSGDQGTTWTQTTIASTSGQTIEEVAITVNSSGQPIIAYQNSMTAHLFLGKATAQRPTTYAQLGFVDMNQFGYAPNPQGVWNNMSLVKNPSNGYLFFVSAGMGNGYITAMRSTDGGASWGTKYTFGTQNFNYQDVQATIDNQGRVVAIYNTKNSSTTSTSEIYMATSVANDVSSWGTPVLLDSGNITTTLVNQPSVSHDPNALASQYYYMWRKNASGTYTDNFLKSNQPPSAPVITYPPANSWINTRTPTITWTFSDPDSGDSQSSYIVQLVNSAYSAVIADSGWVASSAARSFTFPSNWITSDGTYYVRMLVQDSSGAINSPSTGTPGDTTYYNVYFGVDTVNPTGGATDATTRYLNASNKTATFTVNAADNVSLVNVRFAAWGDVGGQDDLVWYDGTNNGNGTWSRTVNFASHDGGIDQHYNVHVYAYDVAGNALNIAIYNVYIDTVVPTAPTQTNGILYATSNGVSWSAFSDGSASSGLLSTIITLQKWNGSSYVTESGYPKSVAGLSYNITGLTPGTQYRWGVTYTDNASNVSTLNYTTFTTNSYTISTFVNISAAGVIYNRRPKLKFTVTDANDVTISDFQIQASTASDFSTLLVDATKSVSAIGWTSGSLASGGTNYYQTQTDLPIALIYYRARAYDGKEWGTWSSTVSQSISTAVWPNTIASDDTAISRVTINDLRARVNSVRQSRGLATISWTDPTIVDWNGATPTDVRAAHLIELRQAIVDMYTALSKIPPTWTDNVIDTTIDRKGQHWIELRNALVNC